MSCAGKRHRERPAVMDRCSLAKEELLLHNKQHPDGGKPIQPHLWQQENQGCSAPSLSPGRRQRWPWLCPCGCVSPSSFRQGWCPASPAGRQLVCTQQPFPALSCRSHEGSN